MAQTRPDRVQRDWEAVPNDRQAYYRRVYQRALQEAGATTDDAAELEVLYRLVNAYRDQALVPVGSRWAEVPERVRRAARKGHPPGELAPDLITSAPGGPPRIMMLLLLPLAGLLIAFVLSLNGGTTDEADTLAALSTATITPSPTPVVSPTPTPLALEDSDRFIRAGETSNRDYFPVLLQIYPADARRSRVYVVQERAVETADWRFDPNPDVASWVSGLLVRPVLGLPFSEDNADLLAALGVGAEFVLQMNTGARLTFRYAETQTVARQEAAIFRQVEPGLVLVLIGETGDDGLLTDQRPVVFASYQTEQEVERLQAGDLAPVVLTGQPGALNGLPETTLTVLNAELAVAPELPADTAYALVEVDISTGSDALTKSALTWLLEDAVGNRVSLDATVSERGSLPPLPDVIPPHSGVQASLGFLTGSDGQGLRLLVAASGSSATTFALTVTPPPTPATVAGLDVQLRQVEYDNDEVYVTLRLFNPESASVTLSEHPTRLVLGYTASPLGPALPPMTGALPTVIDGGAAHDLTLMFPYAGEPYGLLTMLGRDYALQITDTR